MSLQDIGSALQVVLAAVALFLPYYLSGLVLPRLRNFEILLTPLDGEDFPCRKWHVAVAFKRSLGESPPLVCMQSNARNHIESVTEIRSGMMPRRVNLNELGYVSIDTQYTPKGRTVNFEIKYFYSDIPTFRHHSAIYRLVDIKIAQITDRLVRHRALIVAQWRALWVMTGFCLYAILAIARLIYLGLSVWG